MWQWSYKNRGSKVGIKMKWWAFSGAASFGQLDLTNVLMSSRAHSNVEVCREGIPTWLRHGCRIESAIYASGISRTIQVATFQPACASRLLESAGHNGMVLVNGECRLCHDDGCRSAGHRLESASHLWMTWCLSPLNGVPLAEAGAVRVLPGLQDHGVFAHTAHAYTGPKVVMPLSAILQPPSTRQAYHPTAVFHKSIYWEVSTTFFFDECENLPAWPVYFATTPFFWSSSTVATPGGKAALRMLVRTEPQQPPSWYHVLGLKLACSVSKGKSLPVGS